MPYAGLPQGAASQPGCFIGIWPDAPANLGAAGAERVAPRLRLQILGLRKVGWGSVRENACTATSGICQTAETSRRNTAELFGACPDDRSFGTSLTADAWEP
jgi:hypothetical protein